MNETSPSVGIIGAGSAGLVAADYLSSTNNADLLIEVFDAGKSALERRCPASNQFHYCVQCKPCNIMCGVGGAGTYSSGILNLHPKIGGNLVALTGSEEAAKEAIEHVEHLFTRYSDGIELYDPSPNQWDIKRIASAEGIEFIPIKQRLMGSDHSPEIINKIHTDLVKQGVIFHLETTVIDIRLDRTFLTRDGEEFGPFDYILVAPGRFGMIWLSELAEKLGIPTKYEPLDIGVRVEVKAEIMKEICDIQRDPKFHIFTKTHDDFVRTFCTNHQGFVVLERYEDGTVGVNGHSFMEKKSKNTNFALLARINLTEPLEDSTRFGKAIANIATTLGGGKPIVQRLRDLRNGRRSTLKRLKKSNVTPTLSYEAITPGDISLAYPGRIIMNLLEGLEQLNEVIPGVASDSTLLYAPEIKYSAKKIETDDTLETTVENLYVAGDGAGLSRGIVAAGVTGLISARAIATKLETF
ncbi:FAD-dependent oxidoreductase [Candidatus Bathyarchaeota archaeon]|nr:FAD-dependent oxidoreductase [Candidatus Bathyarchaeota archaeon]